MPVLILCPACQRPLRVRDDLIGRYIRCPGCQTKFVAQPLSGEPPAPPESGVAEAAAADPAAEATVRSPAPPAEAVPPVPAVPAAGRVYLVLLGVLGGALLLGLLLAWRVSAVVAGLDPPRRALAPTGEPCDILTSGTFPA